MVRALLIRVQLSALAAPVLLTVVATLAVLVEVTQPAAVAILVEVTLLAVVAVVVVVAVVAVVAVATKLAAVVRLQRALITHALEIRAVMILAPSLLVVMARGRRAAQAVGVLELKILNLILNLNLNQIRNLILIRNLGLLPVGVEVASLKASPPHQQHRPQ